MENSSPTSPPPQTGCLKGCLIAFICGTILIVAAGYGLYYLNEYQHNVNVTERSTRFFNSVKAGDDGRLIFVFDQLLVEMLASDEQCIANLTHLKFIDADLSDPRYEAVAKLKKLRTLHFYSCYDAEKLLAAMQGMPSVEEITFDSMRESKERERLLETFPNLKKVNYE
jgi:hypothetical protein